MRKSQEKHTCYILYHLVFSLGAFKIQLTYLCFEVVNKVLPTIITPGHVKTSIASNRTIFGISHHNTIVGLAN